MCLGIHDYKCMNTKEGKLNPKLTFWNIFPNLAPAKGRWYQEVLGGVLVGVIALPLALAFGVSAFAPLGPGMGAVGAVAGMTGAIITGFMASLFGGCAPQVTGPTGPMSVVTRSTLATFMAIPALANVPPDVQVPLVILLFGVSVIMGGVIQLFLSWTKLGNLVRALPYPVVAGFMNGVSLLILIGQIRPFLGWAATTPWDGLLLFPWPTEVVVGLLASLVTVGIILLLPLITKVVPASFVALLGGTGVYYLLTALWNPVGMDLATNTALIGPIPSSLPLPIVLLNFEKWVPWIISPSVLGFLVQQAVVLGVLGSIDTLLTSVISDLKTGTRHNSNRELFGQGLGNLLAGIFGALPGAGATVRTLVNVENGGRSGLSGMVHSLMILAVLLILGPLAQGIPLPVLGAILVVMAVKMIDVWSFELLRKKSARGDSLVLWLVTLITIAVDLIVAVGVGLVVAVFLYVRRQTILGSQVEVSDLVHRRSRVLRNRGEESLLTSEGPKVQVVTLRGSLFFGSADEQMGRLENLSKDSQLFVLNLEHLESLDLTGAKMLIDLAKRQKKGGLTLFWGGIMAGSPQYKYLKDMELDAIMGPGEVFETFDASLEAAENWVIQKSNQERSALNWEDLDFWSLLSIQEQELLKGIAREMNLPIGEVVFTAGDRENHLYFVLEGRIEVLEEGGRRLAAYGPGQPLGLMSWIESGPKTYTGCATQATRLIMLPAGDLDKLLHQNPSLGYPLLKGLAGQLTTRLRRLQGTSGPQ